MAQRWATSRRGRRRSFLVVALSASHAQQNAWKPEKPVELVVPTTPGGAIDTTARLMQKVAQNGKLVPTPIVILNKPGGGQTVAMTYLDQRAGDAHAVLVSTMSVMTNHILGRSPVNYTDYTALPMLYGEPMTIVVKTDSPLKSGPRHPGAPEEGPASRSRSASASRSAARITSRWRSFSPRWASMRAS